ncbi:MAG TPA: protein kinase [Candidatus Sulfotelmatobacter sp.]|nr:protein kinase [Candidatus Sulfotelmatobacter sp.]
MLDEKPKDLTPSSSFDGPTIGVASSSSSGSDAPTVDIRQPANQALSPDKVLGGRYEILQKLGEGGMGAVYKARDREVDRLVALKIIRPDLAANPEILRRFKQELVLARQITHKNVVRIYDLGEAAGVKFITMEYVDGEDLKSILRRSGKLPPTEAVVIMQQVCRALDACHSEGVIHRDLKPSNIMRDKSGKVLVMDFGLAHNAEGGGFTQTGVVLGTLEYMSPEQAQGMELGPTADIYSAGLIFYELLTGKAAYEAQSAMASLVKRTHERAIAASTVEKAVPRSLSAIVSRCIEPNAGDRYQSVAELLADLEAYQPSGPSVATSVIRRPGKFGLSIYNYVAIAFCLLLVVIAGLVAVRSRIWTTNNVQSTPVSILVSDFNNETSDPVFDETLEPAFNVAMEGASFISSYNRGTAHRIAAKLQPGATRMDEQLARLVATREGINTVISGSIKREGDSYRLSIRAVEGVTGKEITAKSEKVAKQDVLAAVGKLAAGIRKALGDTTPESVQLAAAETYTTHSLDAAHEYALAQLGQFGGKYNDAIEHSQKALQFDPEMGRAYVVLAVVYNNMKQPQQAEKYFKLALSKIDHMSDREKYRTRASYYLVSREPEKALEELQQLVAKYPADNTGLGNLALAYFYRRDMARALEIGGRAADLYPKDTIYRNNVGLYAMYAGDFDAAIREQKRALELNPNLVLGYVGTAVPQLALGRPADAITTYQQLQKLGADGVSAATAGLADVALYQGRVADAIKILDEGVNKDTADKNPDAAAGKLATLSQAQLLMGNASEAVRTAERALAASHEIPIQFWAARAFVGANQEAKALAIIHDLNGRLDADPQAYGNLLEGEIQLQHNKPQDALKLFLDSRKIADTWMGHFDAGRAYVELGAFAEADSELETCQKRRGEATALFLDESPTYYVFPPVYYYLGRAQEGLKSSAASDSYKTFMDIKNGGQDPLLADARRRVPSN